MKRYLFFPTASSDWDIPSIQYVLCGSPRIVDLQPQSDAYTFLWEQISPDPLLYPVFFYPNNTSKNVSISIPNYITSIVELKITLNGDTLNPKYLTIIPFLIDNHKSFSKGKSNATSDNSLNDLVPLLLAPYPPLGAQAINYVDNTQLTGIRFKSQSYRQATTKAVTVSDNTSSTYIPLDVETRVQLKVNNTYNVLKDWQGLSVLSQDIIPIKQSINITYPTIIADEYNSTLSKGKTSALFNRTPYLVASYSLEEISISTMSKGKTSALFNRTPYLVASYSLEDNITNNFSKGKTSTSFVRIPYTSNIVG